MRSVLINQRFKLRLDGPAPDERLSFYDAHENRERYFYINGLERHNRFKEFEESLENLRQTDFAKAMSDEQLDEHIKKARASFEQIYRPGRETVSVKYETEDEIQLSFHTIHELEQKPDGGQAYGTFHTVSGGEFGPHGCNRQICELKGTPDELNGTAEVELFFSHIPVLGEIITA